MVGRIAALRWRLLQAVTLAIAFSPLCTAQKSGSFRTITSDHGLPQNSVNCMLQDAGGFMVLGTKQGLSIYDGTRFATYRHNPEDAASLPTDMVWSVCEFGNEIWIGTSGGLCRLDRVADRIDRVEHARRKPDASARPAVYALTFDPQGTLWIGTGAGLERLPAGATRTQLMPPGHPLHSRRVNCFLEQGDVLWIGSIAGLFRVNPRDETLAPAAVHREPTPTHRIFCLLGRKDGPIWAGSNRGLHRRDPESGRWTSFRHDPRDPKSLTHDAVWDLLEDGDNLWIGTRGGGLDLLQPGKAEFQHHRKRAGRVDSLPNDRIGCLLKDRKGRLWIGTQGGIAIRTGHGSMAQHLCKEDGTLAGDSTWGINQDADDKIWIATYSGLTVYDPSERRSTHYYSKPDDPDSLSNNAVLAIAIQRDGTKWIATKRGLNRFVPKTNSFARYVNPATGAKVISSNFVYAAFVDGSDRLWIGTRGGVDLHLGDGRFRHFGRELADRFPALGQAIFVLAQGPQDSIYVGTRKGLYQGNADGEFRQLMPEDPRLARTIWSLHPTPTGDLWIGTAHGLGILRDSGLAWLDESNGLPNTVINSITTDIGGNFWVATNWGLARVRLTAPNAPPEIRVFQRADGLQGNEYNMGSVFRDRSDHLYFGGNNGLSIIEPTQFGEPAPDPFAITKILRGGKPIPAAEWMNHGVELRHGENDLDVEFAVLQFTAHDKCSYRYRLTGYDQDWRPAGNRSHASYTRLPPGKYLFEVDGTNNHGVRSEAKTFEVIVHPAFWQTGWFRGAILLAGLLLLVFVFRFRTRSLRDANATLEARVHERTEELTDTVEELSHEIDEGKRLRERLGRAQRMEAFGIVAAGVAHDLNNVLSGLVTYPDLILTELPPDSPLREDILVVRSAGKRAATIVQELQSLTRKTRIEHEVIDLDDVVQRFASSPELRKLAGDHEGIEFQTETTDDRVEIEGSRDHIANALLNITKNAAEAQPDGGKIVVRAERVTLIRPHEGYERIEAGSYAVLSVQDQGVGISATDRKRLFEPFYSHKSFGEGGTGVGLTVVWNTVHDHSGFVDVESAMGEGTKISLYFPITMQPAPEPDSVHLAAERGHGERVLVVDDQREQRDLAVTILEKLGYDATAVASGEAALEATATDTFDLLILDMILEGGIDGLETYERILEVHPGMRAVITSGYADDARMDAACELGASEQVDKPYSIVTLAGAVRRALGGDAPPTQPLQPPRPAIGVDRDA